jgi:hypothetical protein
MAGLFAGLKERAIAMLPQLIETAEPQIETQLRQILRDMKLKHPEEVGTFYTNWKKLNAMIDSELGQTVGARRKRTRKLKRTKKH